MQRRGRPFIAVMLAAVTLGCVGPVSPAIGLGAGDARRESSAPKRIVAAILGDPVVLVGAAELGGASVPGTGSIHDLMSAPLTDGTPTGRRAELAEAVPSFENNLWKVLPNGRMETTWKLKTSAKWHDGTPVTSADLLFTGQVVRDRELPNFRSQLFELIGSIESSDPQTVVVHWKSPFIDADSMFSGSSTPLPKHLLEKAYVDDKSTFMQQPYWGEAFVGTGPFKLRDWVRGSHVILAANSDFVFGRPRVDEIEVRFITDRRAFGANLLAGAIELSLSRGLAVDEAIEVAQQWRDGQLIFGFYSSAYQVYAQFINPSPTVIADVRFRKAMLHAIDRQQMADVFMAGKSTAMHSFLDPGQPQYQEIERTLPRYEYDPRRAGQLIEELGYQRGADGLYRDGSGQGLSVELRNFGVGGQPTFAVGDYWKQAGVPTEVVIIPEQRSRDNEYRMTYPGFQVLQQGNDVRGLRNLHSREVALPENNYVVNNNKARYSNPEYDALVDRYFITIPAGERSQILGQLIRHLAEQLPALGLFYSMRPALVANRLVNFTVETGQSSETWNAELWDVKD